MDGRQWLFPTARATDETHVLAGHWQAHLSYMSRPVCVLPVCLQVRAMLAVPYFEKALYELPEDQLTTDTLLALADEVEVGVTVGLPA